MTAAASAALLALAERVEREEPNYSLWMEALAAVGVPSKVRRNRFKGLLTAGAWRDAAAMLMPSGWLPFYLEQYPEDVAVERLRNLTRFGLVKGKSLASGEASGPHAEARARLAAALRARAACHG